MDARWRPYAGRGPTGQSTTLSKMPWGAAAALIPSSLLALPPGGENGATIAAARSDVLARARHRATVSQNRPPALP
jgi:hypothetical protein